MYMGSKNEKKIKFFQTQITLKFQLSVKGKTDYLIIVTFCH